MKTEYTCAHYLIGIILLLLLSSCEGINNFETEKPSIQNTAIDLKDGRLHFSSREMLQKELDRLKDIPEEEAATYYEQRALHQHKSHNTLFGCAKRPRLAPYRRGFNF